MSGTRTTPPRAGTSPAPARERALDAGVRLWIETPPAQLYGGLNVSRIAKAAGITRATFYTYWGTTEQYLDELADHVANTEPSGFAPELTATITRLVMGGGETDRDYLDVCSAVVERLSDDPTLRLRLGLVAKLDDPVVAEKLRSQYDELEQRMSALYAPMLERWGRVPRPPLEQRHLTALQTVLMEGFAARHRLDPENLPTEVYGWASVAWMLILTTTRDRTKRDMFSLGALLNDFATDGDRIRSMERGAGQRRAATVLEAHVDPAEAVRQVRRMLVYRPWPEITLDQLGEQLGVEPEAISGVFGSKHGLGIAVLHAMAREAFDQMLPVADPLQRVRAHLDIARTLLRRSPALTQSATLVFIGMAEAPNADVVAWSAAEDLAAAIGEAQDHGQLPATHRSEDLTITLLRTLLTQFTQPFAQGDARDIDAVELLLRGLGAAPVDEPSGDDPPVLEPQA